MPTVLGVALAFGLDVLAVSVGVGVMQLVLNVRLRLGFTFAGSEIAMQVIGYELGAGAERCWPRLPSTSVWRCSQLSASDDSKFPSASVQARNRRTSGAGLLITSLSISLDSLGVGIALPTVGIPLLPLVVTVSITTTTFTFVGLAFGARLGERYEHSAERAAGAMLVMLAALFAIKRLF